jgi:hypothetical protein
MQADTTQREPTIHPAEPDATRHRFNLTQDELQRLGMFRIAYLVGTRSPDGFQVVIHGADGMAVATADTIASAVQLSQELGLALVAVH